MEPWVAILISAGVALIAALTAVATLGRAIRRDREAAIKKEAKWRAEVDSDRKELGKIVGQRETEAEWRGRVDTDRNNFKSFMAEIRTKIEDILLKLENLGYRRFGGIFVTKSPLRLSQLGRTISDEVDGKRWARRASTDLTEWVKGKDAYEIQEHCFEYVESFQYSADEQKAIRNSAFRNGMEARNIRRVLAIELRDRLLTVVGLEPPP